MRTFLTIFCLLLSTTVLAKKNHVEEIVLDTCHILPTYFDENQIGRDIIDAVYRVRFKTIETVLVLVINEDGPVYEKTIKRKSNDYRVLRTSTYNDVKKYLKKAFLGLHNEFELLKCK